VILVLEFVKRFVLLLLLLFATIKTAGANTGGGGDDDNDGDDDDILDVIGVVDVSVPTAAADHLPHKIIK
jgi:hypothetical protein